jgi:hypothetical protein
MKRHEPVLLLSGGSMLCTFLRLGGGYCYYDAGTEYTLQIVLSERRITRRVEVVF